MAKVSDYELIPNIAHNCCVVFFVEDEADDDVRPSNFASVTPSDNEGDWGSKEAELVANCYKHANASMMTSNGKRDLHMNEYWLVPVRVCRPDFEVVGQYLHHIYRKVDEEMNTAARMNELLPESMQAHYVPGLKGRVYVSAPEGSKAIETLRASVWPVKTAYVHRRLYRLSANESDDVELFIQGRQQIRQEFVQGSWAKIVRGFWKGDIARVFAADMASDCVELQVVPRYVKENFGKEELELSKRPERALFDFQNWPITSSGREVELHEGPTPDTFWTQDGRVLFKNGLQLFRVMARHYIVHYQPTAEEVELFTLAGVVTRVETNRSFLNAGDEVFVKFGDDIEYDGRVRSRTDSIAVVDVEEKCVDDWILSVSDFTLDEVERILDVGSNVVVRLGICKGVEGVVVDSDGLFVTIFSPERNKQVCDALSPLQ